MSSLTQRIRDNLVALRMPRALEILDQILRRQEQGEITTIEAIDMLLAEEYGLARETPGGGRPEHLTVDSDQNPGELRLHLPTCSSN